MANYASVSLTTDKTFLIAFASLRNFFDLTANDFEKTMFKIFKLWNATTCRQCFDPTQSPTNICNLFCVKNFSDNNINMN